MKERITLTSDFKPLSSQPDGPWQAGAGRYTILAPKIHGSLCLRFFLYSIADARQVCGRFSSRETLGI